LEIVLGGKNWERLSGGFISKKRGAIFLGFGSFFKNRKGVGKVGRDRPFMGNRFLRGSKKICGKTRVVVGERG